MFISASEELPVVRSFMCAAKSCRRTLPTRRIRILTIQTNQSACFLSRPPRAHSRLRLKYGHKHDDEIPPLSPDIAGETGV